MSLLLPIFRSLRKLRLPSAIIFSFPFTAYCYLSLLVVTNIELLHVENSLNDASIDEEF